MKRYLIPSLITSLCLCATSFSAETIGVVNFSTCVSDSKIGKQEQASFETLKKQMTKVIEETEKQLTDLTAKFNDPDYLDGLSPDAEAELKNKFRSLSDELNHYQSQYYQTMNQANMQIVHAMNQAINTASEKIAKEKKIQLVINKEACFYCAPSLDLTSAVLAEMDKNFKTEQKEPQPTSK